MHLQHVETTLELKSRILILVVENHVVVVQSEIGESELDHLVVRSNYQIFENKSFVFHSSGYHEVRGDVHNTPIVFQCEDLKCKF